MTPDAVSDLRGDVLRDDGQQQVFLRQNYDTFIVIQTEIRVYYLLFLFILELERGLDASPLVQESPPHVDLSHVSHVEADKVQGEVEHEVGEQLLHKFTHVVHGLI